MAVVYAKAGKDVFSVVLWCYYCQRDYAAIVTRDQLKSLKSRESISVCRDCEGREGPKADTGERSD
jgi:hypothetical protein